MDNDDVHSSNRTCGDCGRHRLLHQRTGGDVFVCEYAGGLVKLTSPACVAAFSERYPEKKEQK